MPRLQLSDSDDDGKGVPAHKSHNQTKAAAASSSNNNNSHHEQKKRYFQKAPTEEDKQHQRELNAQHTKHAVKAVLTEDGTEMPVKENTKVFVDGLPFQEPTGEGQATIAEQITAFCTAWKVGKVVHVSKKPGQGFAYVAFRSPNSVEVAITVLNGKRFMGRALKVELPKNVSQGKGANSGGNPNKDLDYEKLPSRPASAAALNDAESYTKQVLLSDLPPHAQPDILRELFSQYCPALEPHVTKIKMTSRNRKAFVTLDSEVQAKDLADFLSGFTLLGRRIEAQMAQPPGVAQWSPFQMAQMKKDQTLRAVQQEAAEKARVVPAGWGGKDGGEQQKKEDDKESNNKNKKKSNNKTSSENDDFEIVGNNAKKRFPMPVLIDGSLDDDENKTTTSNNRRRGREDDDANNNTTKKPTNSASSSRFNKEGARVVYVANLSDEVTESRLRKHFAAAGGILRKCELSTAGGSSVNGLATIEYALPADAETAVKKLDGSTLGGQQISVELDGAGKVGTYGYQAEDEDVIAQMKKKADELDDDEEDAFARHYGVKDRKKFLKKYSTKGGDDSDSDDDSLEEDKAPRGGGGKKKQFAGGKKGKKY